MYGNYLDDAAKIVAEKGIDAASVGLNPDGSIKEGCFF